MMTAQTKLRQAVRRIRGAYIENVRAGRCKLDKKVLKEFDQQLEICDGRARALSAKR